MNLRCSRHLLPQSTLLPNDPSEALVMIADLRARRAVPRVGQIQPETLPQSDRNFDRNLNRLF
jgi:hypothetical protein